MLSPVVGLGMLATSRSAALLFAMAIVGLAAGCSGGSLAAGTGTRRTELVFGTPCTISIPYRRHGNTVGEAFELMRGIDAMMSAQLPDSDLSRVNQAAGTAGVEAPPQLLELILRGVEFGRDSGGLFDITIGPLVRLWGIGTESPTVPAAAELTAATALVDYRLVRIDLAAGSIAFPAVGMALDLGGIAKGYAADAVSALLRERDVPGALLDFGENIHVFGSKPSGEPWRIAVQHPDATRGAYVGIVEIEEGSVVTSGKYERFFVEGGHRYHHILDSKTGFPVENGIASVTIVTAESIRADALSTAVFVMGLGPGLRLIQELPGVEAIVLTEDQRIHLTDGLRGMFVLTDESFAPAAAVEESLS